MAGSSRKGGVPGLRRPAAVGVLALLLTVVWLLGVVWLFRGPHTGFIATWIALALILPVWFIVFCALSVLALAWRR